MKYSKIFRTLALVVILSLLMLAIPATPALAQAIYCSPTSGTVGTTVTVTGTGYTAYTDQYVYILFNYSHVASALLTAGTFAATFSVPSYATVGIAYIYVQHTTPTYTPANQIGIAYFTVTKAEITLSPSSDYVGEEITVTGTGFGASKAVTITFDGSVVTTDPASVTTDTAGGFTATFTVPASYNGSHTVKAMDASNNYDTATFTTKQSMSITPTSGATGDSVTVSGTGFKANSSITITFSDKTVATSPASIKTDGNGSFSGSFSVPPFVTGTYEVEASDGTYSDSAEFTVEAAATFSPTTGNIGTPLTISGTGFTIGGTVTITYDGVQVATATIDNNGAFTAIFEAPASIGGDHTITATDGINTKTFTFTMESTSPSIPPPLLPFMGEKAESKAYFDWEDVDDPSKPVTYTLQIASDADFTTIVLEKEGLTVSEYTLTEEERLESTGEEAPYYWRVRAIDGASNASDWTLPGSFFVGFVFELKGWILYALMGAGGILLFFLGLWIGRRTAFY